MQGETTTRDFLAPSNLPEPIVSDSQRYIDYPPPLLNIDFRYIQLAGRSGLETTCQLLG